ncbi:MAG TPA: pyridoxal-phosphate dependent enzyme, partial [Candidatus Polarisedimenticolia bacterium]
MDLLEQDLPKLSTPLREVDGVWVKFEHLNPSGSVKDRVARHVLLEGLRSGRLVRGQEVVEPTSGNAGIALSFWASRLGLKAVVFMPENMSEERKMMIRGHGARLVLTPEAEGVVGAIKSSRAYAAESPKRMLFDQFDDEAGVEA